jgi:hypothetical protein
MELKIINNLCFVSDCCYKHFVRDRWWGGDSFLYERWLSLNIFYLFWRDLLKDDSGPVAIEKVKQGRLEV